MKIGDAVKVLAGTHKRLSDSGYVAEYMTEPVDGMEGVIVADHRDVVGFPHLGVDLGFEYPVGISESDLVSA